jgi:hypothetical protein
MRKWAVASVLALVLAVGLIAQATAGGENAKVLEFKTMAGVVPPYTGPANPIRGVAGAGAPWRIDRVSGKLRANGDLELAVEGLVLANTGQNPQAAFRAVVSCQSIESGTAVIVNRVTAPFPATMPGGDAQFEGNVTLPSPCFAPIVFVTTGAGDPPRWFSVTGV